MASSVVVKATAPFRSYLNQRFGDLQNRMENLEKRIDTTLQMVEQQTKDTIELQRALLDTMTLLAAAVAEQKNADQKNAEQKSAANASVATAVHAEPVAQASAESAD